MELPNRVADARAPGPARRRTHDVGHGLVEPAGPDLVGDAGECGGEDEDFDAVAPARDRVGEVQEHARVAFHRPADVAQQHERPLAHAPLLARQPEYVAPRAHAVRERTPEVHARSASVNPAPGPALAWSPLEPIHRGTRARDLVRRELREVLVRQRLRIAPELQCARHDVRGRLGESRTRHLPEPRGPVALVRRAGIAGRPLTRVLHQLAVSAPECVERAVECREVVAAMNQERPARVVHVLTRADVHVRQCLGDVEEAPDVNLQAESAQQPAKDKEVAK
jgi:hypothetical protein